MATPKKDWKKEWEAVSKESRKLAKRANQRLVRLEHYAEREGLSEILKFAYAKAQEYISKNLGGNNFRGPDLRGPDLGGPDLGGPDLVDSDLGGMNPVGTTRRGTTRRGNRYKEHIKLYDVSDGTKNLTGEALYKANVMIQRNRIKAMQEFLASESSTLGQSRAGVKTKGIRAIFDKRTNTINEKFLKKYGVEMTENDLKRFFESKKQAKLEQIVGSSLMFVVASVMKKNNLKSNKRELEKFMKSHIDLSKYDLNPEDIKSKKGESYKEYLDRLRDYVDYTGDEVLDDMITKALKEGVNVNNIFI